MGHLGVLYREIRQSLTDIERMFGLLDRNREVQDAPDARPLFATEESGACEVEFENVGFVYEANRQILFDVAFKVGAGKTVAVVGHSGSGKSTLARLLFRFYDVTPGSVKINGSELRALQQSSVRAAIGIVPQDTVLFNDSIFYNIQYGRPTAAREEVIAAARAAHIHEFIERLPAGYETRVGERGAHRSLLERGAIRYWLAGSAERETRRDFVNSQRAWIPVPALPLFFFADLEIQDNNGLRSARR